MNRLFALLSMITLSAVCSININAQGKAPWTATYHWISESPESNEGVEFDAWIYGKKKVNHSTDEPRTACHGGISIMKDDKVFAYIILQYAGKNAKGYIYNATYKQGKHIPAAGKLLIRMKGSIETGPSIKILALPSDLENCPVDGVELIGTPTALDD